MKVRFIQKYSSGTVHVSAACLWFFESTRTFRSSTAFLLVIRMFPKTPGEADSCFLMDMKRGTLSSWIKEWPELQRNKRVSQSILYCVTPGKKELQPQAIRTAEVCLLPPLLFFFLSSSCQSIVCCCFVFVFLSWLSATPDCDNKRRSSTNYPHQFIIPRSHSERHAGKQLSSYSVSISFSLLSNTLKRNQRSTNTLWVSVMFED